MDYYFISVSEQERKKEKNKARELRATQWWKNQIGRGECYYCKSVFHPSELTMDHIIPIARGGKSVKTNVAPCCKECNNKKSFKTTTELAFEDFKK